MLTVLVGGCASHRLETYQELRGAEIQQPAYYYTEVEKKITHTENESIAEPDQFLSEVESKVLKYQKQWQAQLESETPMPNLFYDLSTDSMKAYRDSWQRHLKRRKPSLPNRLRWNSLWHSDTNGTRV